MDDEIMLRVTPYSLTPTNHYQMDMLVCLGGYHVLLDYEEALSSRTNHPSHSQPSIYKSMNDSPVEHSVPSTDIYEHSIKT